MIRSVNRTLDILTCVGDNKGEPVSIKTIALKTGLNKSTCCHIVETLVDRGFLVQISRTAGYVLGIYAYNLTRYSFYQANLIYLVEPILSFIQKQTGYNALFATLINGEKFILKYLDTPDNKLGQRGQLYKGDLYNCATGLAMLATMSKREIKDIVDKVGLPSANEMKNADTYQKLLLRIDELKEYEVIKFEQPSDNFEWEFAISVNTKKEKYALGIGLKTKQKPSKDEVLKINKVLIKAKKEMLKRIEMSSSLLNKEEL